MGLARWLTGQEDRCSCSGLKPSSQHPQQVAQPPAPPVPGNPLLASSSIVHTCMRTHTHHTGVIALLKSSAQEFSPPHAFGSVSQPV